MTENELRQKVVETAKKYLGCNEADGSHRKIIDGYNAHKPLARSYKVTYTDAWCATFVSFISIQCGLTDIMPTECGCGAMIELYRKLGRWEENDAYVPKVGDIISFRVDSRDFKIKTNSHPYCLNLVGRIVAAGGDSVQIKDDKLIVNGKLCKDYKAYFESMNCDINEYEKRVGEIKDGKVYIGGNRYPKYDEDVNGVDIEVLNKELIEIFDASRYAVNEPYVVPKNSFFVLGDNINNSVDSRDFGAISTDNIKGKVTSIR